MADAAPRTLTRDLAGAVALALLLTVAWSWRDWTNLSALRLPDTDDAMRLQQVRDWIAGQPFADLAQHRLGPSGLPMHWSRLPDLVPAGLILLLRPLLGSHGAELTAVLAWPGLLFAAALALTGAVARARGASAGTAMLVAALAYPATTVFVPGRVDHHGLQLVLLLVLVRASLGPGSRAKGVAAGLATVASFAIGMETVPLLAVGGAVLALGWIVAAPGARARLTGYAAALLASLLAAALLLRSRGWDYPACDGFTAQAWRAAQLLALVPALLALGDRWLRTTPARATAAVLLGGIGAGAALTLSPACLSPYGAVDPWLARVWLRQVAEAQPLFGAPFAAAFGYAGLMVTGVLAAGWLSARERGWAVLLAFQLTALAVTLVQLRGAYPGALLAAPALAAVIARARARGAVPLAAAWLVSAGLLYPLAADALAPKASGPAAPGGGDCADPASLARIAALAPGRAVAPIDLSAYAVAASRLTLLGGPYHRDTAGNRGTYALFRNSADPAQALARRLRLRYVLFCPGARFEGPDAPEPAGALAAALRADRPPPWLRPLPGATVRIYAVAAP